MADEKSFAATHGRIARAKREGDVARSHDLCIVASLAAGSATTFAVLPWLGAAARAALAGAARPSGWSSLPYLATAACALAVVVASLGGALAANYLQTGAFTVKMPAPTLAKLNPGPGLKRMFGRDAAIGGAKAAVVSAAVALAVAPTVRDGFVASTAGGTTPAALAALVERSLAASLAAALGLASVFAAGDVLLERAKWLRRLRMSFDDVKRDHKQSEGDPLVRGRRRQQHRALVRGSIQRVREAAVVIVNPTHVAIALDYRPPEVAVPRVIVRAIDDGAREVKRIAREANVPIVEHAALARTLLATVDIGDAIPPDTYGAVAAIVASLALAAREPVRS